MLRAALLLSLAAALHGDGLVVRSPADVGMSPDRLEQIDHIINKGIAAGGFPGAAVIVGRRGAVVYNQAFGHLGWAGEDAAAVSTDQSIYDLASLTKVVGTTTAIMVLFDEGKLRLDDKVQQYVPDFVGRWKDEVTIRMLLTHRGGLAPGRELWKKAKSPAQAREMVVTTKLGARPGRLFMYSDLGADLLGWVVEAASGEPLDRFLHERVFAPLGMRNTMFRPADSLRYRIAPTEVSPPRGHPIRGEVHDENAYVLGGVAGHAGLFSTAADLAVFAQMMLNHGEYNGVRIVADSTVRLFTSEVASARALGWEVGAGEHGAGDYFDEHAFGHTGYTGTSLWIDPDRDLFVILLTNRVHAARARRPSIVISDVRQDVADVAALSVLDADYAIPVMPASFRADRAEDWNRPFRARSRKAVARKASAGAKTVPTLGTAMAKPVARTPAKRP
ncbi:MAG TPA: serine hydrolase [Gemmatimonadaceae bacterium]|nr:serine hydrolase [Gemmatimonadaceae bacterium]